MIFDESKRISLDILKGSTTMLKGEEEFGIFYRRDLSREDKLHAYVDASWGDDLQTQQYSTGILVFKGVT